MPVSPRRRSPPRRLTRSERQKRQDRLAMVILAVLVVFVGALGAVFVLTRPPPIDANGCAVGEIAPKAHTIVLLDETDPLSPVDIDYAKTLILAEYGRLKPQQKLTVRFIDADPKAADRAFSRCRVRLGKEVSEIVANQDMVEAQYKRIAGDQLERFTNGLAHVPPAQQSPIFEAIDEAVESADFGLNVPDRRLVILSDMAQNSRLFSQYGPHGGSTPLPTAVKDAVDRPELKGVEVRVHYLRRPSLVRIQTPAHRRFWENWFRANGADVQLGWGLQLVDPPTPKARPAPRA